MNLFLMLLLSGIVACGAHSTGDLASRLLLVSFDGFRADYLDTYKLPHLQEFIEDGVLVKQVTNAFITKTFPNHYTIVTGLYEESHGIMANDMYDADARKKFSQFNDSNPFWWNEAVPIWVTNQQQGNGVSAAAMWPGTEVRVLPRRSRFCDSKCVPGSVAKLPFLWAYSWRRVYLNSQSGSEEGWRFSSQKSQELFPVLRGQGKGENKSSPPPLLVPS